MVRKFSSRVRSGMLDAYESVIGPAPTLELRTGAPPTNTTDPDSGTLIASATFPSNWMADAASGQKLVSAGIVVTGLPAAGGGTIAGHYRLKGSGGVVDDQGTITISGGGGDATMVNPTIVNGQTFQINIWTLNINGG